MTPAAAFRHWVLDPARTPEELFPVELLFDSTLHHAVYLGHLRPVDAIKAYQSDLRRRARRPRFDSRIDPELIDYTEDWWGDLVHLGGIYSIDRPVRDLSLLRFLPQLTRIDLDLRDADLEPLGALPALAALSLRTAGISDFSALGRLHALRSLDLNIEVPWPTGLDALSEPPLLERVSFRGNLLLWRDVPPCPALRHLDLQPGFNANTPLPALAELAHRPLIETLTVGAVASLAGAERFRGVRTLDLSGPFIDLAPLTALSALRQLRLASECYADLTPLTRLPHLRSLELYREHGIDLLPLIESKSLREVAAPRCAQLLAGELAAVNTALGQLDDDLFILPAPRPLAPLRLIACEFRRNDYASLPPLPVQPVPPEEDRTAAYGDDPLLPKAEDRWVETRLHDAIAAVLTTGWGHVHASGGSAYVVLRRPCDILRLRDVVQATRAVFAHARFPWDCNYHYDPENDFPDPESEAAPTEAERATAWHEEWLEMEQRYARHQADLDREYRAQLGANVEDESDTTPTDDCVADSEDDDDDTRDDLDSTGYTLVLEDPILWVHADSAFAAARHFGQPAEDWHTMPEPPVQRPRRRLGSRCC